MQYVGSLTARPIKITMFLKLQQPSGHTFPNIIIIIMIMIIILIIIQYMHSNYSDKSVQSDETSLIT